MKFFKLLSVVILAACAISCGTAFNQPVDVQKARIGETSVVTKRLEMLPEPQEAVVVGVYNFRDLTGQYKASETGSTFSTAVTQGSTSILIKALADSKWFVPIERENIGNLLNERNIIRSTREEYRGTQQSEPQVPPLLYAGILLEGGIISYDTNILTGGMGARYFGIGGSTQYRQDRVTVYLRAISTSNGKILKNIYISKTILSQEVGVNLFKYVNFQRLLEAEVGFTRNEPVQLAVKEAIEKAVEGLIIEGIEDRLWQPKDGWNVADKLVFEYGQEKNEAELTRLYDRKYINKERKNSIGISGGTAILSGDYSQKDNGGLLKLDFNTALTSSLSLNFAATAFELKSSDVFLNKFIGAEGNVMFNLLPHDTFSPYIYGGGGVAFNLENDLPNDIGSTHFKLQYGIGAEYLLSDKFGLKIFGEHNIGLDDELDNLVNGNRNDHYFNLGIGINYYLGKSIIKNIKN